MKVSVKQYAELLFEITQNKDKEEIDSILEPYINIIIKNNDTTKINIITQKFCQIWDEKHSIVNAQIICSGKPNDNILNEIKNFVKNKAKVNYINIKIIEDANLVSGGIIIKYKDKVIDGSLKARLKNLKTELVK